MQMLNVSFVKWIAVAFVIATPIAWYFMSKWLQGFAYRTSLSWWIFALTGFISFLITMITIGFQSYIAATTNPVKTLKTE